MLLSYFGTVFQFSLILLLFYFLLKLFQLRSFVKSWKRFVFTISCCEGDDSRNSDFFALMLKKPFSRPFITRLMNSIPNELKVYSSSCFFAAGHWYLKLFIPIYYRTLLLHMLFSGYVNVRTVARPDSDLLTTIK